MLDPSIDGSRRHACQSRCLVRRHHLHFPPAPLAPRTHALARLTEQVKLLNLESDLGRRPPTPLHVSLTHRFSCSVRLTCHRIPDTTITRVEEPASASQLLAA